MSDSAFRGNVVTAFIRLWARKYCQRQAGGWCSLLELRAHYERYCKMRGKSDLYIQHDILPTLNAMGFPVHYGPNPGVSDLRLEELCSDGKVQSVRQRRAGLSHQSMSGASCSSD